MARLDRTLIQFVKFGAVGLINTAVFYAVYVAFTYLGAHYLAASVVSFFISVLCSFLLNHKFVFKDETGGKRSVMRSMIKAYVSYAFTGLIVYNALLYLFIDVLLISKYTAPLLGLLVTVPLNYILNKLWTFKPAA